MLAEKLLGAGGAATPYVDDVFSAFTYTGNGSTQTINNGIDLAGKGGLVWTKSRSNGAQGHVLFDTARGTGKYLQSSATDAEAGSLAYLNFLSTGYQWNGSYGWMNDAANSLVGWTFRKAPKFFDVVTWTGNSASRTIAHALGVAPGMIIVKQTSGAGSWFVYHRSLANTEVLYLEQTAAKATGVSLWDSTTATASVFSLGAAAGVNASGQTYVAYLFAHDSSTDGIVQCGSFTGNGTAVGPVVTLGWEPQYLLVKNTSAAGDWTVVDASRGFGTDTGEYLAPNLTQAAGSIGIRASATGFQMLNGSTMANGSGNTIAYLAIRRSNKPPVSGTSVYNAIARTGTGAAATVTGVGFAPDLVMSAHRAGTASQFGAYDRLRGANNLLITSSTGVANTSAASVTSFDMSGISVGADGGYGCINYYVAPYINHFFKRAPGVMDVVCTSNPTPATVSHSLGVTPELVIQKRRDATEAWSVWVPNLASLNYGILNTTAGFTSYLRAASATTIEPMSFGAMTSVIYLFATKAGISKVGNYTGNGGTAGSAGTSQTINCGFTTGSRFVMLKCTSHTSDWVVVDTVRGLIAGSDPALSLNITAAEVTTTDLLDPDNSGFVVNQLATGTTSADFNVTGRTYIFLSFA